MRAETCGREGLKGNVCARERGVLYVHKNEGHKRGDFVCAHEVGVQQHGGG